jgi:hypothetical protein
MSQLDFTLEYQLTNFHHAQGCQQSQKRGDNEEEGNEQKSDFCMQLQWWL